MDADAVFFRNPFELLDDPGYLSQGALFFRDRNVHSSFAPAPNRDTRWIQELLPKLSYRGVGNRLLWDDNQYMEQESSVVCINKAQTFVGLLTTAILNLEPVYGELQEWLWGDKETFWFGYEISKATYEWNPIYGSVLADYDGESDTACGCASLRFLGHQTLSVCSIF